VSEIAQLEGIVTCTFGAHKASEIERLDVAVCATRGTILQKLMEEVLTGETSDDTKTLAQRATELLSQLGVAPTADPRLGTSSTELVETITRTLRLPEVASLRFRLVPEHTVYGGLINADSDVLVSGIAGAVDSGGKLEVIVEWKK